MANYQQYQKYKRQPPAKGPRIGKFLVILAIVFVVYLIGRSLFGTNPEVETNIPLEVEDNVMAESINNNDNSNTNENSNSNENSNANVNTAVAGSFSVETCESVYSRGSSDEKKISLTFNVGTSKEGEIQKVIDGLKNSNTPADFFARGDVAEENPDLINKIDSAGFSIYNLSYNHPSFTDLPESGIIEQLSKADDAISQRTNKTTKPFFRPPYGSADDDVLSVVKSQGYCPVTWTVDALDWSADYSAADSKDRVISNAGNGAIILMQASNSVTAQIVPEIITELKNKGYAIVSLDDLLK
ncbi:polysaccharide deacetylase family protein [Patescibacteria group bacterium]|nr:polysaccharide deacetylase family protein [Patescibacteria group bacterium]MBU0964134.1 polysaccharide deacetylase family protein [Patescibacteria group bacterium]